MFDENIIKNFIEILNDENKSHATAQELNYGIECSNDFLQDLETLRMYGFIIVSNSVTNNPKVRLTFEGVYYGREYLDNYDESYDRVVDLIKKSSLKTTPEISKYLGVNHLVCGAIFIDLAEQGLAKYKKGIGGLKLECLEKSFYSSRIYKSNISQFM